MNLSEIRILAEKRGLATASFKKTALIHAIQKDEGYDACYATEHSGDCGQESCLWRQDCVASDQRTALLKTPIASTSKRI